jgi:hypothetical protein
MRIFSDYNYIHPGFIFIPCRGMTPGGLRAQYFIPNLSPKCECLSTNSSLPLGPHHHAILRNQRKQSLCRTEANCRPQVPLPNPFEETFLLWTGSFTKLGPQIRLPPVPNFGVNNLLLKFQAREEVANRILLEASLNRGFSSNSENIRLSEPPFCHNVSLLMRVV